MRKSQVVGSTKVQIRMTNLKIDDVDFDPKADDSMPGAIVRGAKQSTVISYNSL